VGACCGRAVSSSRRLDQLGPRSGAAVAAAAVRGRSTGDSAQCVRATAVRRTYQRGRPTPLPGIGVNGGPSRRSCLAARRPYAGHGIAGPADLDFRLPRRPRIRSCGESSGVVKEMSGSQQKGDHKLCWNCGERGVPGVGSRMTCPGCEVTWMPWSSVVRGDPTYVCWEGSVIHCVDFSRPGALGTPA